MVLLFVSDYFLLVKSLTKFERTLNKKRTYRFLRARFHVNARNLRARRESVHMQFLICDRRFTKIDISLFHRDKPIIPFFIWE